MKPFSSFKSTTWRPVAGLLLAGLLGWIAAWFMLPSGSVPSADVSGKTEPFARPSTPMQPLPDMPATARSDLTSQNQTFEQLLQKQQKISESAIRSAALPQLEIPGAPVVAPGKPVPKSALEVAHAEKMKAMQALQVMAVADIQAVPPGDTKKLIAAMERFDTQMRAAGAPAIIDMDSLRKMLEAADRLQSLNRQMMTEAEKGRNSDASKLKALSQEIQTVQQTMPRQVINANVLQKMMAK